MAMALKACELAKSALQSQRTNTKLEEAATFLKDLEANTTAQWVTDYSKPKGAYIA